MTTYASAVLLCVAACAGPAPPVMQAPAQALPTKLVVLLVIDQWPEWAFEQKRPELHDGFAQLLAEGEWHVGRYPTAAAMTAPSHALLGTGQPPARTGIVADMWWHRDTASMLEAVHDVDGTITPKWLRVPALGDAIASARNGAKAVDIALKPRVAVLPLGHHGLSIWYDANTTSMRSSAAVPWLDEWNRAHPIAERLHDVWTASDRVRSLAIVPDAQAGEVGSEGFGPTFPHDPQTTKNAAKTVLATPLGDDLVFDLASRALDAENLGKHAAPDLLVLGISAHDYVGHGWGQESWEMWDLDARLGEFLETLDRDVGKGAWAMVVTSDHGASPLPETFGGGRIMVQRLETIANDAASSVLGRGHWIEAADYPTVYLSDALRSQSDASRASAEQAILTAMRSMPGIARAGGVADITGGCDARSGDDRALCLTFDADRSRELYYLPKRGWIVEDEEDPEATGHGSLEDYDRLVPVVIVAPGHRVHAPQAAPSPPQLEMLDVQPLLLRWHGLAH